jgi:hypothetical protein
MLFVYLHVIWFAAWIGLRVEHYPYGLLTMTVSLEAIFLSTFVMISQNRADETRQVLADHQWQTVQQEEQQNQQLLNLSSQILELTTAIHAMNLARSPTQPNGTEQAASSSVGAAVGSYLPTSSDGIARWDRQHSHDDRQPATDAVPPMAGLVRPGDAASRHRGLHRAGRRGGAGVVPPLGAGGGRRLGRRRGHLPGEHLADHPAGRRRPRRPARHG